MKVKKYSLKNNFYVYSGKNQSGQLINGEIQAVSLNLAKHYLQQQNIIPIEIHKKYFFFIKKIRKKISLLEITFFFRQLATLIAAGVPLVQACQLLQKSQKNKTLSELINSITIELASGKGLSNGLKKYSDYFDELSCALIRAGEQTGTLEIMLKRIADNKEAALRIKNKIKQALFYPVVILIVSIIVSLIMLIFVLPQFTELFQNMHGKLPVFTLTVIAISQFIRHYFWLSILPISVIWIAKLHLKKSHKFKHYFDRILLKLPGIQKIILVRIARVLSITFAAGIPITEILKILANTSGNIEYSRAILKLHTDITRGQQLNTALNANVLFPPLLIQMVKVGEESGMLPAMLEKVAEIYESDIEYLFATLSYLLEPLIIVVLGVLIGVLVIAMYLPIFKLGTVI